MTAFLTAIHATACDHIGTAATISLALSALSFLAALLIHLDIEIMWWRRRRMNPNTFGVDVRAVMRVSAAEASS